MEIEQTTIRIPAELKKQLEMEAERRGLSLNALIFSLLNGFWEKNR